MNADMIALLVSNDPVPARLGRGRHWQRVYGRIGPDGATLVYEPDCDSSSAMVAHVASDGTLAVRPWHADPALPVLSGLLNRHHQLRPVRYRPGKRCTLRTDRLFLKCVADDRGAVIQADQLLLYRAGQRGSLGFGVARPAGWLPQLRALVQHRLPGASVVPTLHAAQGTALATRMGAANATLCRASLQPSQRFTYADQMARSTKYVRRLTRLLPECAATTTALMARLAAVRPGAANRPIHGAPHAHQWLDGEDGLMLVDFDRFALGDPELDVATFMAEAAFETSPHPAAAAHAYRDGFSEHVPLRADLLCAYRLHKHIAKALRTATAIRHDAHERALTILREAHTLSGAVA